jgi:hypothetical protein
MSTARMAFLLAALATIVAAPAWAGEGDRDVQARDLFVGQRYPEALAIYAELHARTGHPTYLRNMGRCHQLMQHPDLAIASFRAYLGQAKDLGQEERTQVEGYIGEMERLRTARATAIARPASPAISRVSAAPRPVERKALTRTWWFWTGVGALVVGGVITAVALGGNSSGRLSCPGETICPR